MENIRNLQRYGEDNGINSDDALVGAGGDLVCGILINGVGMVRSKGDIGIWGRGGTVHGGFRSN